MNRPAPPVIALRLLGLALSLLLGGGSALRAQQQLDAQPVLFNVTKSSQRLEMIVNTSRILTLDSKIPQFQVANPELLELTPYSARQIQVMARRTGVTRINLWDENNQIYSVDVVVFGDSRELQMVLQSQFPRAALTVTPLQNSVIVGGFVDRTDHVSRIVQIAEDYHPNIINNITVGGVQQVLLHVKIMEVSRTKLRTMGFDFANITADSFLISSISGLVNPITVTGTGGSNVTFGVLGDNSQFLGFLEALRQDNLVKILADPTLVTVSGRPARFQVGGEIPILVPQSLGTVSIDYRPFGTEVNFVPIVLGNGLIRLEVRPRVSELDEARGVTLNGGTVPAFTVREVDTACEMRAGQTLALAGLIQERIETETRKLLWVGELPYLGAFFRRNSQRTNEIETLILVTPQIVEAMDPHEVPPCGPGTMTGNPTDWELFAKGYIEVPKVCPPQHGLMGPAFGPAPAGPDHGMPYYDERPVGGPSPHVNPHAIPGARAPRNVEEVAPAPPSSAAPSPPVIPRAAAPSAPAINPAATAPAPELPRIPTSPLAPPPVPDGARLERNGSRVTIRGETPVSGNSGVAARPAATNIRITADPNRANPTQPPKPRESQKPSGSAPGFIGPTGYDVDR